MNKKDPKLKGGKMWSDRFERFARGLPEIPDNHKLVDKFQDEEFEKLHIEEEITSLAPATPEELMGNRHYELSTLEQTQKEFMELLKQYGYK